MCYTRRRREDDSEAPPPAGDEALNYIINTHCVSGRPAVLASAGIAFQAPVWRLYIEQIFQRWRVLRRRHLITPLHVFAQWEGAICCGAENFEALLSLAALCVVHCSRDDGLLDSSESYITFLSLMSLVNTSSSTIYVNA